VQSAFDANKRRFFTINGKTLLIRGAGWSSDMMMRARIPAAGGRAALRPGHGAEHRAPGGEAGERPFLRLGRSAGPAGHGRLVLLRPLGEVVQWKPEDRHIAAESQRDQLYRCARTQLIAWFNGSDIPPPAVWSSGTCRWPRRFAGPTRIVSSARPRRPSTAGESGVKMWGPYEWVPPRYWLEDTQQGGAYGFNTETSPGPAVPPIESLRKMIPADKLWPHQRALELPRRRRRRSRT
jgi:exo-1,4-beta-D-glucosaminidase